MQRPTSALVRLVPFYYGWWVAIAAAMIILVASASPLYVFSALIEPLEEEFGWSRAAIGAGPSIGAVMFGVTTPIAGYLVDRVGVRRLLLAGVLLVGGGNVLISQIQALWHFYIAVTLIGVGMSSAGLPVCAVAVAHWFAKRRGRALGIASAGAGATGIMVLLTPLLIGLFDGRTGVMVLGIVQLAICIPLALTVRNRPEEIGLLPDGEPSGLGEPSSSPSPEPAESGGGSSGMEQPQGLTIGQALHARSFWLLAPALVLTWVGSLAVIIHLIPYLDESAGFTEEGAALIAMGIPFGSLVGRLGFGWLADYLSKRWLLTAAWLLQGSGILIFAAVHSPWQAVIFLVVFTPGYGGAITMLPALLAEYFGLRALGGIQGLLWGSGTLGGFLGPILAGAVYDMVDSYRPAFLVMALAAFAAVALIQMMGRPRAWAGESVSAPIA
jgi:OFA family oxalate/formate antiporter-like MFS transporter